MRVTFLLAALLLGSASAWGVEASSSPVGTWKTIDDNTGEARGLIQLFLQGDELQGRIVGSFPQPGVVDPPLCEKCPGERKGKPKIGMIFMWGLKLDGDTWRDGEILDPDSGDVYSAKVHLIDDGKKLEVRGFIGLPLLGRTQVWERN